MFLVPYELKNEVHLLLRNDGEKTEIETKKNKVGLSFKISTSGGSLGFRVPRVLRVDKEIGEGWLVRPFRDEKKMIWFVITRPSILDE